MSAGGGDLRSLYRPVVGERRKGMWVVRRRGVYLRVVRMSLLKTELGLGGARSRAGESEEGRKWEGGERREGESQLRGELGEESEESRGWK